MARKAYAIDYGPGNLVAVGGGSPGRLVVLDEDGSIVHRLNDAGGYVRTVSWSPDGRWIAAGTTTGDLYLVRILGTPAQEPEQSPRATIIIVAPTTARVTLRAPQPSRPQYRDKAASRSHRVHTS